MNNNFLEIKNVSKTFAGVKALSDVSLEIKKGEIHCLAGENGSGKSTLIKVISGVYTPDCGQVIINGHTYDKLTPSHSMAEGVQIIYQDFALFPNLTVAENIAMNVEFANKRNIVNWKRIKKIAEQACAMVGFKVDLKETVSKLTVADKQLVAICRAIINNAKLLIMDEPTTALTRNEIDKLFEVVLNLQKSGMSVLFVSHKLDEVFEISQSFTILRSGQKVATGLTSELDHDKFIYHMTGRKLEEEPFIANVTDDTPIFEVKNLGLGQTIQDISFSLKKGEILGVTGLLGSGRTELSLALFGYYKKTEGQIFLNGKEIQINNIQDAVKNGIGLVPEDRLTEGLILKQSILSNMSITNIDSYRKSKHGRFDEKLALNDAEKWVENLRIKIGKLGDLISTLSGGNQQKVALAKWLMIEDLKVLILNGPTVGVDIGAKFDIHKILRDLAEAGLGIIIISDDIPEIMNNCSRILIMRSGRIVGDFEPGGDNDGEKLSSAIAVG